MAETAGRPRPPDFAVIVGKARGAIALQLATRNHSIRGIEQIINAHNAVIASKQGIETKVEEQKSTIQNLTQENILLKHQALSSASNAATNGKTEGLLKEKEAKILELQAELLDLLKNKNKEASSEIELRRKNELLEQTLKDRKSACEKLSQSGIRLESEKEKLAMDHKVLFAKFQELENNYNAQELEKARLEHRLTEKCEELNELKKRWTKEGMREAARLENKKLHAKKQAKNRMRAELLAATENRDISEDVHSSFFLDGGMGAVEVLPSNILRSTETHRGEIVTCTFDPSGGEFATGGTDRLVKLWATNGDEVRKLPSCKGNPTCLLYSPSGETIAIGSADSTVKLYNRKRGRFEHTMNNHSDKIFGLAYVANGEALFSASKDHTIKWWDLKTGFQHDTVLCSATCYALSTFQGECLAGAHFDRTLTIRDPRANFKQPAAEMSTEHKQAITHICTNPVREYCILTSSKDGTLREFDMKARKLVTVFEAEDFKVSSGCQPTYSPDGLFLASGAANGSIQIWDVLTGMPESILAGGHTGEVSACAWGPRGTTLVSIGRDKKCTIWE